MAEHDDLAPMQRVLKYTLAESIDADIKSLARKEELRLELAEITRTDLARRIHEADLVAVAQTLTELAKRTDLAEKEISELKRKIQDSSTQRETRSYKKHKTEMVLPETIHATPWNCPTCKPRTVA
jgi:hypothetical protein